jgi:hypothetical protein
LEISFQNDPADFTKIFPVHHEFDLVVLKNVCFLHDFWFWMTGIFYWSDYAQMQTFIRVQPVRDRM